MKTLLILVVTVFALTKVSLYAVDKVMDNTEDASIITEHKNKLENL